MQSVQQFHESMTNTVTAAQQDITNQRAVLQEENKKITKLKSRTEAAEIFIQRDYTPALKIIIIKNVDKLIKECKAYIERHE